MPRPRLMLAEPMDIDLVPTSDLLRQTNVSSTIFEHFIKLKGNWLKFLFRFIIVACSAVA